MNPLHMRGKIIDNIYFYAALKIKLLQDWEIDGTPQRYN